MFGLWLWNGDIRSGGIHIQDGDLRGREIGEAVGQAVVDTLF